MKNGRFQAKDIDDVFFLKHVDWCSMHPEPPNVLHGGQKPSYYPLDKFPHWVFTPRWQVKAPAADLAEPIRNIALGACDLLSKSGDTDREHKDPDPIGKTTARMHDTLKIRIKTSVSEAVKAAARDVFEGRRGYSAVLTESVPVRAHLARYWVGEGRKQSVLILRAAHRRGGPGEKQRTYVLQA